MPAGIDIAPDTRHRPEYRQFVRRARTQAGPAALEVDVLELRYAANGPLHQAGDFREGRADIEAPVLGGAADQDFTVVLLRHITIAGGQAALQQLGHALGQEDLALYRLDRQPDPAGLLAELGGPGPGGIDQRIAVKGALLGGAHATDPVALAQNAGDVGVEIKVHAILPRGLGVGVGETERADLMIAEKLQRALRFMTHRRFRLA